MSLLKTTFHFNREYRSLKRLLTIVETAAAYGFQDVAEKIAPINRLRWRRNRQLASRSRPEKFRMLLEELGPTFVKFGQILSTRPDLVTATYANELTKLTEHVEPVSYELVRSVIFNEFGEGPETLFVEFDPEPLAAASIGQVHRATLKDGTLVVVKVQRPGIRRTIDLDLDLMNYIAGKLEEYSTDFARMQAVRIVGEFAYSLRRELNYRFEAANLLRFAATMAKQPGIVVPRVFLELSSERVMTMERVIGDSAAKVLADPEIRAKYDLPKVAHLGVNSILSQIFENGFFHADPHPGNLFLLDGNRIAFIDFGMMGKVSEKERQDFVTCIDHMVRGDIPRMTDAALRMTISGSFSGDRDALERDVSDLVDENINLPLEQLRVSHVLEELLQLFRNYELAIKPNLYMMFKALISIEHLGRSFDPGLKVIDEVKPFLRRLKFRRLNPTRHLQLFLESFGENLSALENLPVALRNIFERIESGKFVMRVEHHRLDDIEETLYVTGERLSRSLLISALMIGSALVIVAKIPPQWKGISLLGLCGFCGAGALTLLSLWADHRQRRRFLRERAARKKRQE